MKVHYSTIGNVLNTLCPVFRHYLSGYPNTVITVGSQDCKNCLFFQGKSLNTVECNHPGIEKKLRGKCNEQK